jgi:hypothetical protein
LLNEASGNALDSVASNNLTDTNTVGTSASVPVSGFAASRDFVGASSEGFTGADAAWNSITTGLTIGMWVQVTTDADGGLVTKYEETGSQTAYWTQYIASSNKIRFGVHDGAGADTTDTNSTFSTGVWYHITAVFNPSTYVRLFVNGVSDSETLINIGASIANTTAPFWIGRFNTVAQGGAFTGKMQDVILWGAALTDSEVTQLYNRYFAPEVSGAPIFFT